MPIFDYKCSKCQIIEIDKFVKFGEQPKCNVCGTQLTMQVGKSNFILNGGGWAKDGYK